MLDISRERMEVAPTAHYSMGGIVVEPETHATERGRVVRGGRVHRRTPRRQPAGRQLADRDDRVRQASRRGGRRVLGRLRRRDPSPPRHRGGRTTSSTRWSAPGRSWPVRSSARCATLMWERCGVVRDEARPARRARRLDEIRAVVADVDVRPSAEGWSDLAQLIDLRAGLLVAEATMRGALVRRESRGCHNRTDYPGARSRARRSTSTPASVTTGGSSIRGARPSRPYPTSSSLGSTTPVRPTWAAGLLE